MIGASFGGGVLRAREPKHAGPGQPFLTKGIQVCRTAEAQVSTGRNVYLHVALLFTLRVVPATLPHPPAALSLVLKATTLMGTANG